MSIETNAILKSVSPFMGGRNISLLTELTKVFCSGFYKHCAATRLEELQI